MVGLSIVWWDVPLELDASFISTEDYPDKRGGEESFTKNSFFNPFKNWANRMNVCILLDPKSFFFLKGDVNEFCGI